MFVDEDLHTLGDIAEFAALAHGINIKLAKSGGIREAVRMAHAARALGLGVMLGCMIESGLGSLPARDRAASAITLISTATCCSPPIPCPGVELVDGVQPPSVAPGSESM